MAKEYTPIDCREVFDTPEYQEKLELLFGGRNGRYVLGLTPEVSTIVEAIGDKIINNPDGFCNGSYTGLLRKQHKG